MEVEVNGIKYEFKEPPKQNRKMSSLMLMAATFGGLLYGNSGGVPKQLLEPSAWLIEEFKLIQSKQSKLSRSNRDLVEASFRRHFKPI